MNIHFNELFVWRHNVPNEVKANFNPRLAIKALETIKQFNIHFDGFATLEAKGFYLAGLASAHFCLPSILIRKEKKHFQNKEQDKANYINWRNEPETICLIKEATPEIKRIIYIDDVYDTGHSLEAATDILRKNNIEVVAALFFLKVSTNNNFKKLTFPIKFIEERSRYL